MPPNLTPAGCFRPAPGLAPIRLRAGMSGTESRTLKWPGMRGLKSALVTWGAHPAEELIPLDADRYFDTVPQMADFFTSGD